MLRQLPVQGDGLGSKQGQLLGAAVPAQGKKRREHFQHSHFTLLPSRQSICFQACWFLLLNHWYSRQNDQLIFAFILTQRTSNTWQKHWDFGNSHSSTPPSAKDFWYKPRKPLEMSSLISTCSQRMGTFCSFSRELQSHCNCTSGLREHISDGRTTWNHQQQTWRHKQMCDSGSLANRISHQITFNEACPAHRKWILWVQQKSDPSLCLWWLFTHQKAVSLGNTCLYAFFSPSWAASWQNHHYFLSKINTALQEFPLMLFPQTNKIRS